MTAIDLVLAALVLISMAALGVTDARRMIVDPRMVLALVCAGLLWRLFGSAETGSLRSAGLGAALGVGVVAVPIAWAHLRGRRWPLFPGDAMLLGGLGFVLGPLSLGWALLAGALCSLLHRAWLQRRRGRSFLKGYCPLGPGMAAGAMAVFVFVNAGGALAASDAEIPLPQPKPGAIQGNPSGGDTACAVARTGPPGRGGGSRRHACRHRAGARADALAVLAGSIGDRRRRAGAAAFRSGDRSASPQWPAFPSRSRSGLRASRAARCGSRSRPACVSRSRAGFRGC